jgi:hypothetical protein
MTLPGYLRYLLPDKWFRQLTIKYGFVTQYGDSFQSCLFRWHYVDNPDIKWLDWAKRAVDDMEKYRFDKDDVSFQRYIVADCKLSGAIQQLTDAEKEELQAYAAQVDKNREPPSPPAEVRIKLEGEFLKTAEKLTGEEIAKRVDETERIIGGG